MKIRYSDTKSSRVIRISMVLFLIGVTLGAISANILKDSYFKGIEVFGDAYFDKLYVLDIDHGRLLSYILWNNFKRYFIFWIFAITAIGIPYMMFAVGYVGFCTGFLLSVAIIKYGLNGFFLFLLYLFPQYLLYFPVAIIVLVQGYQLCVSLYYNIPLNKKNKMSLIFEKIPVILFFFLLIILGSLSEAYINSLVLQKMLRYF